MRFKLYILPIFSLVRMNFSMQTEPSLFSTEFIIHYMFKPVSITTLWLFAFTALFMLYALVAGPALMYRIANGRIYRRTRSYQKLQGKFPTVSIIRPLKGIENNLWSNLESSFLQDYPKDAFEILFCVSDEKDECIALCERLMKKYPNVKCSLLIGMK